MTFGHKLQTLRKEKGISQEKLADRLGVSRQAVSKWELDITLPETENIIKIRNIFSVSFDYLMDENITERNITAGSDADTTAETVSSTTGSRKKEYNRALYIFFVTVALISGILVLRFVVPFIPVLILFVQSGFDTSLMSTVLANAVKFYTPSILMLLAVCLLSLITAVKVKTKDQ